uniref:Uncharacterized protein n=1 Tax=Vespula pensylvanica TaxID=30213 RepID=A0A834PAN3_VESPE|nr:hypothetical protein H0235_002684 [Vespula pensylvanica]
MRRRNSRNQKKHGRSFPGRGALPNCTDPIILKLRRDLLVFLPRIPRAQRVRQSEEKKKRGAEEETLPRNTTSTRARHYARLPRRQTTNDSIGRSRLSPFGTSIRHESDELVVEERSKALVVESHVRNNVIELWCVTFKIDHRHGKAKKAVTGATNGGEPTLNLVQRPARPTSVGCRARKFN